jgi:spore germination cell wall hydrolase CwlJ-like protein
MTSAPSPEPLPRDAAVVALSTVVQDTLARTIWGEARGLGRAGMVAVGWVIKNRAARPSWWGRDIVGVCLARAQFSCWNASDPNRAKLLAVSTPDPEFAVATEVADDLVRGTIPDPTNNATHYHTIAKPEWATVWPPDWTKSMTRTADDGHHVFYRAS